MAHHSTDIKRGQDTAIARAAFGIAHLLGDGRGVDAAIDSPDNKDTLCGSSIGRAPVTSRVKVESRRNKANIGAKFQTPKSNSLPVRVQIPPTQQRTANGQKTAQPFKTVRFCIETSRICLGLKKSAHLQRYLPLHDHSRETGKQGFTYPEFYALMDAYGIPGTRQYHARLLREGRGLFWNIANGIIYPAGYIELSIRLCKLAYVRGLHDLYIENNPGQRKDMYIRVSGSCAQFEGAILASWYMAHNCPTISRWTLERLFNRDRRSIWHIEAYADVTIIYNEAETTDPADVPLKPDGSEPRGDVYRITDKRTGVITFHYRLANTYQPHNIRQHHKRGQGRKAHYRFLQWFDTISLHTNRQGESAESFSGLVQVNSTGRIYCSDDKTAKRSRKRGNDGQLFIRYKPGVGDRIVWRVNSVRDERL